MELPQNNNKQLSNKLEEENLLNKETASTNKQADDNSYVLKSFFNLPAYCDYNLCTIVLKLLITTASPIAYTIGITYATGYYSVTYFAINAGTLSTVSIYAS